MVGIVGSRLRGPRLNFCKLLFFQVRVVVVVQWWSKNSSGRGFESRWALGFFIYFPFPSIFKIIRVSSLGGASLKNVSSMLFFKST